MNLLSLKYFIAITNYSSFSKAAEHLYITQPTISRRIADIEKEFGVQLFERSNRFIRLTDAGHIFLNEAKEIVSRCDSLAIKISNAKQGMKGTLKIGYQGFLNNQLLSDSLNSLSREYSHFNFSLFCCNFAELNHFIMDGTFDIIFTVAAGLHTLPGIVCHKVEKNSLQIVVPSNHSLSAQTSVRICDIADENFIMIERSVSPFTVDHTLELCLRNGFSPKVSYYALDAQSMLYMVGAGKGIAFMFSRVVVPNPRNVKVLGLLDCDIDFNIVIAHKIENHNPVIPLFISEVKKQSQNS